ncbi:hypothetical protein MCC02031_19080 [Bifidobacteriaceae bacterium MCC02031]|nr:hypothetical protein MCC02031_19080 [Bifidobacteriaceae bacterium MCC02031]
MASGRPIPNPLNRCGNSIEDPIVALIAHRTLKNVNPIANLITDTRDNGRPVSGAMAEFPSPRTVSAGIDFDMAFSFELSSP